MTSSIVPGAVRPTARPGRRPRRRAPLVVAAAMGLAVLASACHQDNTPQFYNSVTKDNFTQGCIGASSGTGTTLASPSLCDCLYTVTTGMIPASTADEKKRSKQFASYSGQTFTQINNELKTNPNKVPTTLQSAWKDQCRGYVGATTTTAKPSSSGGPTTTG